MDPSDEKFPLRQILKRSLSAIKPLIDELALKQGKKVDPQYLWR